MLTEIWTLQGTDPHTNLVIEQWAFDTLPDDRIRFILWINNPCVVIGRGQNPWIEANLDYLSAHNIPLIRRISGGGTVVHDHGNLNISYIAPEGTYTDTTLTPLLRDAMGSLGIQLDTTDRNDLLWQGRKVSGSAYRVSRGKGLHHSTLLINSDLATLSACLKVNSDHIDSVGVSSKRMPVANLSQARPGLTVDAALFTIAEHIKATYPTTLGPMALPDEVPPSHTEALRERTSWDWNFGRTPKFTHYINGGRAPHPATDMALTVNQGHITGVQGPSLPEETLAWLGTTLTGVRYDTTDIFRALDISAAARTALGHGAAQEPMVDWIRDNWNAPTV